MSVNAGEKLVALYKLYLAYSMLRPMVQPFKNLVSSIDLLDVGCGDGVITQLMAHELEVNSVVYLDRGPSPSNNLPRNASFTNVDVCSEQFLQTFAGRVNLITCIRAFHEFEDPLAAALNMCRAIPPGGYAFIVDRSEMAWKEAAALDAAGKGEDHAHYLADRKKVDVSGLDTWKGVENLWGDNVISKLPGSGYIMDNGAFYSVVYQAR